MRLLSTLLALTLCASAVADRPIILVTPGGVFQSIVGSDGLPGPWQPLDADVIVQGFSTPVPGPGPTPPPSDATVQQIATISQITLSGVDDARAVVSILDALVTAGVKPAGFAQILTMAAESFDRELNTGGRLTAWVVKVLDVTTDPAKLKAGVLSAWPVPAEDLQAIAAAQQSGGQLVGRAVDFAKIIEWLLAFIQALKNLGLI